MTERENLYHAITRSGKAEWLPISDDCLEIVTPSAVRDRPVIGQDGYDWFGCYWKYDDALNGYAQPLNIPLPLTDITQWKTQVQFPKLDSIDWESSARADLNGKDLKRRALQIRTESGPFERLHQLYGFENALIAMYDEPEAFLELMEAITEFRIEVIHRILRHYPADTVLIMDDLGSNRGPLISVDMYREFIKPFDARIIEAIHQHGPFVVYHSCGCIDSFIPELIDIRADILHPLQGGINDQTKFEQHYGNELTILNGLDNLIHLPETTEMQLRAEIDRVMTLFWEKKNLIVQPKSYVYGFSEVLLHQAREYNRINKKRKTLFLKEEY